MINYTVTPGASVGHTRVYSDDGKPCTIEAVSEAPDFCALLDTVEDELRESLESGAEVNFKDLASALVLRAKRDILGELLVRLLVLLSSSENVKYDIEVLISAAGLPIRDEPDSAIAARFGQSRQAFSARRKTLMERLGLTPPPHSKSLKACEAYKDLNRRNATLN
jgi:hypothetical protein